ncbi:hypothetical protein F5880DRAFT_691194 [Lentinula raphanica]|nr:hypothetical protein F5880DRAFT_691194 [Lentinula raphanica]
METTSHNLFARAVTSGISSFSSNLTSVISFLTTILGVVYLLTLLWVINISRMQPRALKRDFSRHLQRYAPFVYIFIVLTSLVEVLSLCRSYLLILDSFGLFQAACAFWLLVQYVHQQSFPSSSSRSALHLVIFCSCWTLFTAGVSTILFIHPIWSTHPIASVGSQSVWVILTLCIWFTGTTVLACSLPSQFLDPTCDSLVYCGQMRVLFALSLLETIALTGATITMLWIVRLSIREALKRVSRQFVVSMMLNK